MGSRSDLLALHVVSICLVHTPPVACHLRDCRMLDVVFAGGFPSQHPTTSVYVFCVWLGVGQII